jgi:hypothetical protein
MVLHFSFSFITTSSKKAFINGTQMQREGKGYDRIVGGTDLHSNNKEDEPKEKEMKWEFGAL